MEVPTTTIQHWAIRFFVGHTLEPWREYSSQKVGGTKFSFIFDIYWENKEAARDDWEGGWWFKADANFWARLVKFGKSAGLCSFEDRNPIWESAMENDLLWWAKRRFIRNTMNMGELPILSHLSQSSLLHSESVWLVYLVRASKDLGM